MEQSQSREQPGNPDADRGEARVARYRQSQANTRREFAHQASHALAVDPRYLLYVFEALKVKNMTRSAKGTIEEPGSNVRQKAGLNRSILASAWGQTKQYLQYKARRAGKLVVEVPPFHSSQECGRCGHTHPDNRRTQSEFVCQACGHTENADRNAARVIQSRGVRLILFGESEPALETVPTPTEFSVSRETVFRSTQGTSKWEAQATTQEV